MEIEEGCVRDGDEAVDRPLSGLRPNSLKLFESFLCRARERTSQGSPNPPRGRSVDRMEPGRGASTLTYLTPESPSSRTLRMEIEERRPSLSREGGSPCFRMSNCTSGKSQGSGCEIPRLL